MGVQEYRVSSRKKLGMEQLQDVHLPVSLVLGTAKMKVRELLNLKTGKVVEIKRLAGETVDFTVNNKVIARGEVVVIEEHFGIRLVTLLSPEERLKQM